jgi:anti-sigma factor RsiW
VTVDHDRYADDLAAYALGALSDAEAEAFERHLTGCDACARELEQARAVVGALPAAVPQHRAPPQLKRAVMRAIGRPARERRRLSLRRPALALAGGLAAAALALGEGVWRRTWPDETTGYWFSAPEAWDIDDPTRPRALMYQRARGIWELLGAARES